MERWLRNLEAAHQLCESTEEELVRFAVLNYKEMGEELAPGKLQYMVGNICIFNFFFT